MESIQFPIVAYCLSSGGQDFKVRSGSGGSYKYELEWKFTHSSIWSDSGLLYRIQPQ